MYMNEQKLIPKDKFDLVTTEDSIWKRTDERSVAAMKASAGEVYTVYGLYCAAGHGEQRILGGGPLSGLGGRRPSDCGGTSPSPPALQGLHVLVP